MAQVESEKPAVERGGIGKKRRRRSGPDATYGIYTRKIAGQTHPSLSIGSKALSEVNGVVANVVLNLTKSSAALARVARKNTLSAKHVQAAVRVSFPAEMSKFAVSSATKAVSQFAAA
jgi:histone H3/H4